VSLAEIADVRFDATTLVGILRHLLGDKAKRAILHSLALPEIMDSSDLRLNNEPTRASHSCLPPEVSGNACPEQHCPEQHWTKRRHLVRVEVRRREDPSMVLVGESPPMQTTQEGDEGALGSNQRAFALRRSPFQCGEVVLSLRPWIRPRRVGIALLVIPPVSELPLFQHERRQQDQHCSPVSQRHGHPTACSSMLWNRR
jgi:hypothetical protein